MSPRKRRVAKLQRATFPDPAIAFFLLTGDHAPRGVGNWVEAAQVGLYGNPTWEELLEAHADALVAEARAYGFRPHCVTGRRPTGAGFEAWRAEFLAQHGRS
jgi:hypothetical protein